MPLSEHEQRLLDEMERNLYSSEADVVTSPESGSLRPNYRGIVYGSILGVLGVAALVVGVIIKQPLVGVLGFVVMALGVFLALRPASGTTTPSADSAPKAGPSTGSSKSSTSRSSFSATMQRRWDKRRDH